VTGKFVMASASAAHILAKTQQQAAELKAQLEKSTDFAALEKNTRCAHQKKGW